MQTITNFINFDMYTDNDRVIHIRSLTFFKDRFEGVDANKRTYVVSKCKCIIFEFNEICTGTTPAMTIRSPYLALTMCHFFSHPTLMLLLQISFFKHLAGILTKADYTAMRMGFTLVRLMKS